MAALRVGALPEEAGAAAAMFHAEVLPRIRTELSRMHSQTPLPFRGGDGGGGCPESSTSPDSPHPNPSPEGEGLLTLIFHHADHSHRAWRLAAVQALAREHAPVRVNAIASNSEPAIAAGLTYLEAAEGITGQVLELDDTRAGEVVTSWP